MSQPLIASPMKSLQGKIALPGDKSISHRSIFLTALGKGKARIENFLSGEDCRATARAFQAMGVSIEFKSPTQVIVHGKGKYALKKPDIILDMGNSGTTTRLLMGVLAAQDFSAELMGDASLSSRPMKRVVEPLTKMGASFSGPTDGATLPIKVHGGALNGMTHKLTVASAQVKSSLLLAGLYADASTTVIEPHQTRDHTERMMRYLRIDLKQKGLSYTIDSSQEPVNHDIIVPGDISSAAFFIVAAAAFPGSHLILQNVGLNLTRSASIAVLKEMGADIQITHKETKEEFEPYGDIEVRGAQLKGTQISGEIIPYLIDELPILAVAGALAHGTTTIKDAKELRVKESDRIKTMVTSLRALGAKVEELEDGMVIEGPTQFRGGISLDSYGDHRVAMSLAIAALFSQKKIQIENPECIPTSFPQFQETLNRVVRYA